MKKTGKFSGIDAGYDSKTSADLKCTFTKGSGYATCKSEYAKNIDESSVPAHGFVAKDRIQAGADPVRQLQVIYCNTDNDTCYAVVAVFSKSPVQEGG